MEIIYTVSILLAWIGTPLFFIVSSDKPSGETKPRQQTHFMRG